MYDHIGVIFWEIAINITFTVPFFMFTLNTFIIIFNEEYNTFISIGLINLDLGFRVEG